MSTVTENDLREIKDLINSKFEQVNDKFEQVNDKFEQINSKFEQVNDKLNDLKIDIAVLKEGQNGINKRIDNLDFLARTVVGGVILALIVGLAKLLFPNLIS